MTTVKTITRQGKLHMKQQISRNKLLGLAGTGWMFDAMDVGILSFVIAAVAIDWNLTPEQMGWIGSVNSIGMAVGAFLFGMLADKIGRKQVFMMTIVMFSVASGYDDACHVLSCHWLVCFNDDIRCFFTVTLFRWRRIRWGTTSCLHACIRKRRST